MAFVLFGFVIVVFGLWVASLLNQYRAGRDGVEGEL